MSVHGPYSAPEHQPAGSMDVAAQVVSQLTAVLDARFETWDAKFEHLRSEQEHGDRTLEQTYRFLRDQANSNTVGIGQLSAEVQTLKADQQRAFTSLRDEVREALVSAIRDAKVDSHQHTSDATAPISDLSQRLGVIEFKLNALKYTALGVSLGSAVAGGGVGAALFKYIL